MFFWNSLAFSMIQWILAIWSLVPLPFLYPAWTSESSCFTNCWSLAWRILSVTFLACEMSAIVQYFQCSLDQSANIHWIIKKAKEFQKNIYFCFSDYAKAFDCVDHHKLWKILKEMGIPDHLTCLLKNMCAGQEATVRTGNGTELNRLVPN